MTGREGFLTSQELIIRFIGAETAVEASPAEGGAKWSG
jgi:hypothetical protein